MYVVWVTRVPLSGDLALNRAKYDWHHVWDVVVSNTTFVQPLLDRSYSSNQGPDDFVLGDA